MPTPTDQPLRSPRRRRAAPRAPQAVTLVELLLVLVLLTVIAGLAAPALTGSFASTRLRRAGDEVVAAWSKARRYAIESGLTYQFLFKPEENVYRIEPFTSADALALAGDSYGSTSSAATSAASSGATSSGRSTGSQTSTSRAGATRSSRAATGQAYEYQEETDEEDLPDEVVFQGGQIAVDDPLHDETQVTKLESRGQSWGRPILFFPDGTSSDASIVLKNTRDQYLRVTLRGLTGVGRATAVMSKSDATKPDTRRQQAGR